MLDRFRAIDRRERAMTDQATRITVSRAAGANFEGGGLRDSFAYRDLGISEATAGAAGAHVIRVVRPMADGTGRHRHGLSFQMVYVLKGSCAFWYEGDGEVELSAGDCVHQPPGILHELLSCSDDCELLEITLPADFTTEEA